MASDDRLVMNGTACKVDWSRSRKFCCVPGSTGSSNRMITGALTGTPTAKLAGDTIAVPPVPSTNAPVVNELVTAGAGLPLGSTAPSMVIV